MEDAMTIFGGAGYMLFRHLACSIYLLEHAIWSYSTGKPTKDTDIEVFIWWTGSLAAILM